VTTDTGATVQTQLEFLQYDDQGLLCAITPTAARQFTIPDSVHHFVINYTNQVAIAQTCGGSRRFQLSINVTWLSGNPVKIDEGSDPTYHSSTNVDVVVTQTDTATTVPALVGATEATAQIALQQAGLTEGQVTRVINSAPVGTVLTQNSPGGTLEPVGSPVNLTISLGSSTVPNVLGESRNSALADINARGLTPSVSTEVLCESPGDVIVQNPAAGTTVAPGSTVSIVVDSGTRSSCGVIK
jgi:hypothetical protein